MKFPNTIPNENNMKSLISLIALYLLANSALAQDYQYQPVGLFKYGLYGEGGTGPHELIDGVGDQNDDGYDDFVVWVRTGRGAETLSRSFLFHGGDELDTIPDQRFTEIIKGLQK